MKNTMKVLWYIIMSAMVLAMFVLVSAKVLAHGDGKCITDADGDVFLRDDSYVKIDDHLSVDELKLQGGNYEHGHRNQYYDKHGNETTLSTSFFGKGGGLDKDEFYVDCPTTAPTPKPIVSAVQTSEPAPVTPPPSTTQRHSDSHFYDFSEGHSNFIGLPVVPADVDTVKDLWEVFMAAEFKNDISFQLMANSVWQTSYRGEDNGLGETAVTPHLAVNVGINSWVTIRGEPIAGEEIELAPGVHFVGLPEIPVAYKRPSDLLIDGVAWVHVKKDRKYLYIYAEGDDGDDLFYAGQAFVIRVVETLTLDLRGNEVAAAPMAQRQGTLATSWGAIKEIR